MTRCWSIHREITAGRTEGGAAGRVDNAYVGLTLIPVIDRLQVHWQVWVDLRRSDLPTADTARYLKVRLVDVLLQDRIRSYATYKGLDLNHRIFSKHEQCWSTIFRNTANATAASSSCRKNTRDAIIRAGIISAHEAPEVI